MLSHAKKGYYALQDYTVQYWFEHLLECVKFLDPITSRDKGQIMLDLTQVFLRSYGHRDKVEELLQAKSYTHLAGLITKHLPTHGQERNSYFCIDIGTESLRQKIANLNFEALTAEEQKVFVNLHGPRTSYKCSKPWCHFFKGELGSEENRQKHIDEHEFPYRCAFEDCLGFRLGFSTDDELQKHDGKWHTQQHNANSFPNLDTEMPVDLSGYPYGSKLLDACARGDIERVKTLLESEAGNENQVNKCGYLVREKRRSYPLTVAAEMGHTEICDLLISSGALVESDHTSPLYDAAAAGHLDVCDLLISRGADVNSSSVFYEHGFPLHGAGSAGFSEVCDLLLQRGADINSEAYDDHTPLHWAAKEGHISVVSLLLRHPSIQPNKKSKDGTAAEVAAISGQIEVLRLMKASGKVDIGPGVLQSACKRISGPLDTIKYLLSNGHANLADEKCVWTVLGAVQSRATGDFLTKVRSAISMLLSTGNPVFGKVKRLGAELGYEIDKRLKDKKKLSDKGEDNYEVERSKRKDLIKKRTTFLISIMEYPRWRITSVAWSRFLTSRRKFGMTMDTDLEEVVNKFVKRVEDNRRTIIFRQDRRRKEKNYGVAEYISLSSDDEMHEVEYISLSSDDEMYEEVD